MARSSSAPSSVGVAACDSKPGRSVADTRNPVRCQRHPARRETLSSSLPSPSMAGPVDCPSRYQPRPTLKVATRDLGDAVEIRIRDNGTFIPARDQGQVVAPVLHHQADRRRHRARPSISWDIVTQQHGGTIAVDSRVGEYTEFTIRLARTRQATTTGAAA
jgi:Histidine kinase-, DNA gyrase B-, and HSP90-like ATPase